MAWHDEYRVWLTESQSLDNAQNVVDHFYGRTDWSRESICALVGNMRHESSINPDMYEYGYDWSADRGYGLVQWTPRSKYWDWAVANGKEPRSGNSQLDRIDYEVANNIQWIPRSDYGNMTFAQFRTNSGNWSIDYLTEAFTWGYERPNTEAGWASMPDRKAFAHKANNELDWSGGGADPDPGDNESGLTVVSYIEQQGDSLYIKLKGGPLVPAYPNGRGWWIPAKHDDSDPTDPTDPTDPEPGDDALVSPAEGRFTSGWGARPPLNYHYGIDIAPPTQGDTTHPFYAAKGGTVRAAAISDASSNPITGTWNTGSYLVIDAPDGTTQWYGHAHQHFVSAGDVVPAGKRLGTMGERGNVTGVHLHFEWWTGRSRSPVDPEPIFLAAGIPIGSRPSVRIP